MLVRMLYLILLHIRIRIRSVPASIFGSRWPRGRTLQTRCSEARSRCPHASWISAKCAQHIKIFCPPPNHPPTHVLTFAQHPPASFFDMATPSIRQLTPPIGFTKTLQQQMTNKYRVCQQNFYPMNQLLPRSLCTTIEFMGRCRSIIGRRS